RLPGVRGRPRRPRGARVRAPRRRRRATVSAVPRVRRIRADEAEALRAIRLRALADTPLAFGSTHAREAAYPPERWEKWARESVAAPGQAWFLALAHDDEAGAGAATDPDTDPRPVGLA